MKQILLTVSFCCFSAFCSFAQTEETVVEELPIAEEHTTAGMINREYNSYEEWDAELNRQYNALLSNLDNNGKAKLKTSQVAWIKQRDLDFALIDAVYGKMKGTMYLPMRVAARTEVVRKRAKELAGLNSLFEF